MDIAEMNLKSILEMNKGGIMERCNAEVQKVLDNIQDINTPATKTRTLTLKIEFKPNSKRDRVNFSTSTAVKLAPYDALESALYIGCDTNGEVCAMELMEQTVGQQSMIGDETPQPSYLKLVGNSGK